MKILVTGGAGFIGSHIVDHMIQLGHNISIIDNLSNGRPENVNPSANIFKISLGDNSLKSVFMEVQPEIVIHHAAQVNVSGSIEYPQTDAMTNIVGTISLLEKCQEFKVKKIIYASSAAVYGSPQYNGINEEHNINPESFYGISKHVPEQYIKIFSNLYNLDYTILRYSNVYGPRQYIYGEGGVISTFINQFISGEIPVIYGNGEQTRDFIYVKDVVNANAAALKQGSRGTFNISTNQETSIYELFFMLCKLLEHSTMPRYLSQKHGDILHSRLDNRRAKDILGWTPQTPIDIGLKATCQYYLKLLTEGEEKKSGKIKSNDCVWDQTGSG